jgi:hydrogenase/urease accessory protein HupE
MNRVAACAILACLLPGVAAAHPVPFSFIDARIESGRIDVTVVAHIFDLANDIKIQPPEKLLEQSTLAAQASAMTHLLDERLQLSIDGRTLAHGPWSPPEALPERQSVRFEARYDLRALPGRVDVTTLMFPYDPQHKTFLNVYENGPINAQAILDQNKTTFHYFADTRQGRWAAVRHFLLAGMRHILSGPAHLMFLAGLLLLGGTFRQMLVVVAAFAVAHTITLALATLGLVIPPMNAVEPAIALSVVYIGADNLLVGAGGRDTRAWAAFAFGLIHGFGFARGLGEMDVPPKALGWALISFNIGVEIGQFAVVVLVAVAFAWVRTQSTVARRRLAVGGSVVALAAGAFWFIQRVFFSGGTV